MLRLGQVEEPREVCRGEWGGELEASIDPLPGRDLGPRAGIAVIEGRLLRRSRRVLLRV